MNGFDANGPIPYQLSLIHPIGWAADDANIPKKQFSKFLVKSDKKEMCNAFVRKNI